MSIWKVLIVISVIAIISLSAWWAKDGYQFYTKDKIEVITKVKDDIFGVEVEKSEWVDKFRIGVLPDDPHPSGIYRSLLFPVSILVVTTLFSWYKIRKE